MLHIVLGITKEGRVKKKFTLRKLQSFALNLVVGSTWLLPLLLRLDQSSPHCYLYVMV